MLIYGAGMAGLLAGTMLRRYDPIICEAQPSLPHNHAALLRFRSEVCGTVTNLPFKKVKVEKAIHFCGRNYYEPNLYFNNMYSQKVAGVVMGRSIRSLEASERFIAPEDFITQMSKNCHISFSTPIDKTALALHKERQDQAIISTVPMPIMMKLVDWPSIPEFKWSKIWSVWGKIKTPATNTFQTIYFPDIKDRMYRASITGDVFIVEYIKEPLTKEAAYLEAMKILHDAFGIDGAEIEDLKIKEQEYGKLLPIEERVRKEFILYMTDEYGIYSLGRFATWRQLLMDDVVKDIDIISNLAMSRDNYKRRLYSNGVK